LPCSAANWTRRLSGTGTGSHSFPLYGLGVPKSLIREIAEGNKYTVAHKWGDHVAYAGVISNRNFNESSSVLTVASKEFRSALLGARMTFGVDSYNAAGGVLTVTDKSRSGAVRIVLTAAMAPSAEWALPVDLPSDSAGGFDASWRHEETLTIEDLIRQVEDDGVEVDFRPYIHTDGTLRYETRVDLKISAGGTTDIAARAPGSIVTGLEYTDDYANAVTGVIGFGNGTGQDRLSAYAPTGGSGAVYSPVRDIKIEFPDIYDQNRLQRAVTAAYEAQKDPVSQWSFGLHVYGTGPQIADPGRTLNMFIYGSAFAEDGRHPKRVIALSGGLGYEVTPEVQDG